MADKETIEVKVNESKNHAVVLGQMFPHLYTMQWEEEE